MARLMTLDAVTVTLRNELLEVLTGEDEAILLPQAARSEETGAFKNIVFRLSGDAKDVNGSLFAPHWFDGVSVVRLSERQCVQVNRVLSDEGSRRRVLGELQRAIPSELSDHTISVGPKLDCEADERDLEDDQWVAGFDSSACFVGVYSAEHSKVPENGVGGMRRVHETHYLVCRAGAGQAAATFHARVLASCSNGLSLDNMFDSMEAPGPQALRRLSRAASRNRARILLKTSKILGIEIPSVPDNASRNLRDREAVCDVDVSCNVLRKLDDTPRSTWQYSTGMDGVASKGLLTLSNAGDGVVLFLTNNSQTRIALRNESWACLPFGSKRVLGSQALSATLASAHGKGASGHPDRDWIVGRFSWRNNPSLDEDGRFEPFSLWGSHEPERFVQAFSRELGIADFQPIRLRPELVCCGGIESGKLRAIARACRM